MTVRMRQNGALLIVDVMDFFQTFRSGSSIPWKKIPKVKNFDFSYFGRYGTQMAPWWIFKFSSNSKLLFQTVIKQNLYMIKTWNLQDFIFGQDAFEQSKLEILKIFRFWDIGRQSCKKMTLAVTFSNFKAQYLLN